MHCWLQHQKTVAETPDSRLAASDRREEVVVRIGEVIVGRRGVVSLVVTVWFAYDVGVGGADVWWVTLTF